MTDAPPEKLDAQLVGMQCPTPFQFLPSLLLVRRGWFASHTLHLTQHPPSVVPIHRDCSVPLPR